MYIILIQNRTESRIRLMRLTPQHMPKLDCRQPWPPKNELLELDKKIVQYSRMLHGKTLPQKGTMGVMLTPLPVIVPSQS